MRHRRPTQNATSSLRLAGEELCAGWSSISRSIVECFARPSWRDRNVHCKSSDCLPQLLHRHNVARGYAVRL